MLLLISTKRIVQSRPGRGGSLTMEKFADAKAAPGSTFRGLF